MGQQVAQLHERYDDDDDDDDLRKHIIDTISNNLTHLVVILDEMIYIFSLTKILRS